MAFTSTAGINPQQIYETITRKFTYPGGKGFKRKDDTIFFSNNYDEPTYLSFRIDFDFDCDNPGDGYNELPHALLNVITKDFVGHTQSPDFINNINPDDRKHIINDPDNKSGMMNILQPNKQYSAFNYLYYALGERERARMLLQFKMGLYDLVKYCPYYITSINGLGNLMKVIPNNGIRVPSDSAVLTLKCNEAIDMRVSQIMNLYRKVAWDDVYQRWILPDIMRYFRMYIYISEIRVFHSTSVTPSGVSDTLSSVGVDTTTPVPLLDNSDFVLINSAINNNMPTIKLECNMCEFDMSDTMSHINDLSSSKSNEPIQPTIKIKIGNIKEVHSYGLNKETDTIDNHIYADSALQMTTQRTDSDGSLYANPVDQNISDTIYRLGVDVTRSGSNTPFDYSPFNRDATELAREVNGIMQKIRSTDVLSEWDELGVWNTNIRSMATFPSGKRGGVISNLIGNIIDQGEYQLSKAVQSVIDRGMEYIFNIPLLGGMRLGDIIQTGLTGNPIPIISAIKNYINDNASNHELEDLYHHNNSDGMLKEVLTDISLSAATSGKNDKFIQTINFVLDNSPSAADVGRNIDKLYDDYLKGLTSEATTDKDHGYREPTMQNIDYRSSANENGDPKDGYSQDMRGLSSEANADKDYTGYQDPRIIRTPYVSSANAGYIDGNLYDPYFRGTSNEASADKDYNGYEDPNLRRPPFASTANTGTVTDAYDPNLRGLSDEANEDTDKGYTEPPIDNPPYISTANSFEGRPELYNEELHGLSDEANEDTDKGYTEQKIDNPEYQSTAVDSHKKVEPQERELYSEANEDRDGGYTESKIEDKK